MTTIFMHSINFLPLIVCGEERVPAIAPEAERICATVKESCSKSSSNGSMTCMITKMIIFI